jgi:succinyl-CoA synthetase beta subunit
MNIHEYQAKALLHDFGVPISRGVPVLRAADSDAAAKALPGPIWVVKSQIHAGGRGKGKFKEAAAGDKGGVRIAKSVAEVNEFAKQMLGATLVTVQTGPHGKQVNRLYIEEGSDIDKEFYLSILVDRETSEVSFVVSTEGGVNIEDVAHNTPEKIVTFSVDPATGIMGHHGRTVAKALKLSGDLAKQAEKLVAQLYNAFTAKDMAMLEINPLVVTKQGDLRVLDAKVTFDGNALYRHPDVVALRDETEEDAKEIEASKYDLNYVTLDGNIGCMVNGAGLAMATMDIIKLYGMAPANFLDVGGGADKAKVTAAFKIITADPNVKGILINIFGGIMKCDIIAEGVVAAVKDVGLKVPLVVRLEGTNVDAGKKIIRESGLNVLPADHLAAPTPLEEHRKLAAFAGEWNGQEVVYPSRWNAGGPATSHVVARIDLNGFYLIQDARQMRDGKESFATHGVFTYDREDRLYKLFWHDSLGYYPPSPASGGWTGKALTLVRGSLRGNARHVYEILDDNSYSMKIQFSPDAEGWADVLTGVYRRIN